MNVCRTKFGLITGIGTFLSQLALSLTLGAAESPPTWEGGISKPRSSEGFLTKSPPGSSVTGSALDANGVRHRGVDYAGKRPPWLLDVTKTIAPDYPDRDRILRHEGEGLFQLKLDLKTGLVTKVTVIKSTGFPALDTSALVALRQWRWKSGKWKEIEIGLAFTWRIDYRGTSRFPPKSLPFP